MDRQIACLRDQTGEGLRIGDDDQLRGLAEDRFIPVKRFHAEQKTVVFDIRPESKRIGFVSLPEFAVGQVVPAFSFVAAVLPLELGGISQRGVERNAFARFGDPVGRRFVKGNDFVREGHADRIAGDLILFDSCWGKVRAMLNDTGKQVKEAGPSTAVELLGLTGVPQPGEHFREIDSEKEARDYFSALEAERRESQNGYTRHP